MNVHDSTTAAPLLVPSSGSKQKFEEKNLDVDGDDSEEQISFEIIPQVSTEDVTGDNSFDVLGVQDDDSDEETSVENSPQFVAVKEEIDPTVDPLEVPEEEMLCSNCSLTPCEWLNWKDVLEPYFREVDKNGPCSKQEKVLLLQVLYLPKVWCRCSWEVQQDPHCFLC